MSATFPGELVELAPGTHARDAHAPERGRLPAVGHWVAGNRVFCVALAGAATLRVLVAVAYAPALEFFGDSYSYLGAAGHVPRLDIWHPILYPVVIRIVSVTHGLVVLTTLQHVAGLVTGILVYRLVRSFGVGSVGGTIAALPVLFDAYHVNVEQYVLSEAMFILLLVIALRVCTRLVRRPATSTALWVGLLLAALTLTRTVGLLVLAAVLGYLVLSRVGWWNVGMVVVALAVPVLVYALAFRATFGVFGLQGYSGLYSYGVVAPYADCRGLHLAGEERLLCPKLPTYARPGLNQYVWGVSPVHNLTGDTLHRSEVAGRFAHAVMRHQPGATAYAVAGSFAHYFDAGRSTTPRDWFVGSWQFPLPERSPAWNVEPAYFGYGAVAGAAHGRIVLGLAQPLRDYQAIAFVPGPLLLVCLLLTIVAFVLRRGDRPTRLAAALLAAAGTVLLLAPASIAGFDWRYLLPAQAVLVPAGVLAFAVVRSRVPRRVPRGAVRGVTTVVVVAGVASNVAVPSVYAAERLRAAHVRAAPAALPIGTSLRVHVGRPQVLETACVTRPDGSRWRALTAFPVDATYRSGDPVLVEQTNFAVAGHDETDGPVAPGNRESHVLPDVLLGPRYPHAHGGVFVYLTAPSGRLDYVDPRGAGAAAWTFRIHDKVADVRLGARCSRPTTWSAGESIRTLRVLRLPPFTEVPTQRIDYALTWNSARAVSFDVRWRQGSAQTPFGAWRYPQAWQHTTATSQTLVNLAPGYTYCFSVRARDVRGVATAWSRPRCTTKMTDDTSLGATREWRRSLRQTGFYLDSYSEAAAQGAMMATTGTYSRIGVVAYRCPACGVLQIYSGRRLVRSLDLRSSRAGLFAWISPRFEKPRSGRVTLRVVTRDRPVIVDAFGLQR